MTASYRAQVAVAFEVLAEGLAPFVDDRMSKAFPDEDWILMAASKLGKRRDVLVSLSDPHFQLEVLTDVALEVFQDAPAPPHHRLSCSEGRRIRAIAPASRSHLPVSIVSCFRPLGVSL